MSEKIDLFERYELLPAVMQSILNDYSSDELSYEELQQMLRRVEAQGYTFDYGLDAAPYNLRPLGEQQTTSTKNNTMKSKARTYLAQQHKAIDSLPSKYKENFEAMQEFAEIMQITEPGSLEHREAKVEWEDYDEQILTALQRDYPAEPPIKKPAPAKVVAKKATPAKKALSMPPLDEKGQRRIDDEALDALEAHIAKLPQTKALHTTQKGNYNKARTRLHDKIIAEEVEDNACIRRDAPIAILTGGLPGSGKSTFIRKKKDWMTNPAIFKIDSDDIRAKLPEYQGWNASQTHAETQDLTKTLLNKVGKFGCSFDVIYDGTMNKSQKYKPLIDTLKKEGYRIFIMFMVVDKNTSMKRAMGRYQRSGRYVPRFVIEEVAANGLAAFNELKELVDGYILIDGATQTVIEKGGEEIPDDRDYTKLSSLPEAAAAQATPKDCDDCSSKKKKTISVYSWKKKADLSQFSPITLNCQYYHLPVKKDTRISLKKTGSTSVIVTAKPGDHIIFDEDGYVVYVMEAQSFRKKCTQKKSTKQQPAKTSSKKTGISRKTARRTTNKRGQEKLTNKTERTTAKPSAYMSSINAFDKEVENIRMIYKKPDADPKKLREELVQLAEQAEQKNYQQFIERKIKRLKADKVRTTKAEIIRIGIAIRPMVQSIRGTLQDAKTDNRKVLEPSLDNLIRWAKSPGKYDLAGVDASVQKEPTVKAKVTETEKQGFLEWIFSF